MPTNKDAEMRYRIIDRCLSNRLRKYTIYDLVDEVNRQLLDLQGKTVSKRTIQKRFGRTDFPSYALPLNRTRAQVGCIIYTTLMTAILSTITICL